MEIRLARVEEHVAVGELVVAAYADFLLGEDDPYRRKIADSRSRAEEAELWVAADGEVVLGTLTRCPTGSPWREIARDHEGEFRMLAVAPAARGRGVGAALVRDCHDRFRADGMTGMALSTLPEMTTAHRIYERLGYTRDPSRDWRPFPDTLLHVYASAL